MRTYATILCLLLTVQAYAVRPYTPVHPDPLLETWRWRSFPELKGRGLGSIAEDRDGNIWFVTNGGVTKYDGFNWTTVSEVAPSGLYFTRDGRVYSTGWGGLMRLNGSRWERVFPSEGRGPFQEFIPVRGQDGAFHRVREARDGSLWVTGSRGALHFSNDRIRFYCDPDHAFWARRHWPTVEVVVLPDAVIPRIPTTDNHWGAKEERGMVYQVQPGGPADEAGLMFGDQIVALDGDPNPDLRLLNRDGSTIRLTVKREGSPETIDLSLTPRRFDSTYRYFDSYDVFEDRDGGIWFGTWLGRIVRYDPRSQSDSAWQLYDVPSDLAEDGHRPTIWQDRSGTIWVITSDTGPLNVFDGQSWRQIALSEFGGGNYDRSILETEDGTIWIGTGGGLYVFRDGRWQYYDSTDLSGAGGRVLKARDGALWFSGGGQPYRVDLSHRERMSLEGLEYRCETTDGSLWFVSSDRGLVRNTRSEWIRYGVEDGLMDDPTTLLPTRDGGLWAAGSDGKVAAVARFDGATWHLESHPELDSAVFAEAVFQAADGALWFGSQRGNARKGIGGMMRYDDDAWEHFPATYGGFGPSPWIRAIGQVGRDTLWVGPSLQTYDGQTWSSPKSFIDGIPRFRGIDAMISGADTGLWASIRGYGVIHYDPSAKSRGEPEWSHYDLEDGLADVSIHSLVELTDGSVLASTASGISRFDGRSWTKRALPFEDTRSIFLKASSDGSTWVNRKIVPQTGSRTYPETAIRYRPETMAPETRLTFHVDVVSQPGNTTLAWEGEDPWRATPRDEIQFAYRLNQGEWSSFSSKKTETLLALASGDYTFEVKARDRAFNEEPTPAVATFTVVPPVWLQSWFIGMVIVFVSGISFQTARVVRRDRRLRQSNEALSDANKELFQVNVDLQREQVLERLRGQAQGMQSSEDIGPVVEAMHRELTGLGLPLINSGFNIYLSETETERWTTSEDGRALEPFIVEPLLESGHSEARRRGDDYYHRHFEGEGAKEMFQRTIERGNPRWKDVPEESWPREAELYCTFFEGGAVVVSSEEAITEEYLTLIKRFGEVFGYAHSRSEELKQKEAQNRRLAVEASVQRLRAEVQSMDEASDFERILSLLTESLKTVELSFDGCEIDVLDEPVESPTMEDFETNGFRYTTFRLDVDGNVAPQSYNIPAPFQPVNARTIERFIAGEPWQGTSEGEAIVEVPAGPYGRLRLTATDRQNFAEDEVVTLREFADAVALGYARYLDIREIQEATEKKSAFLASMSHELRTPMNAIKGFTNLVLGRDPGLADRSRENLQKVDQASDHLLGMINDLLDLSKIEAGRMDVNPEPFDVRELVTSACDTVSPLIQEGVELRQDLADDIGEAHTDKARVQQMVINLLSNAIKFTDSGSVTVSARAEDGQLVVSVSDTGKGISAEELPTIFDEYRQAEGSESTVQKGTGLGLSITKKFAELLGGTIGVESEVGKGSTFTVRVPASHQPSDA